jgi:TRAP-type C4-dicarboxylate transport system substrate-binding protein
LPTATRNQVIAASAAAAAVAVAVIGGPRPPGKSGSAAVLELRLAAAGSAGSPAAATAARFARRAESRSDGSLRIVVTRETADADAIDAVRSGRADIGVVAATALARQGATTLRALEAPFLVTSWDAAARVTASPLADRLQGGLGRISLTGLALVPEGLERPFGYLKPLVSPADFAGLRVRTEPSKATAELLRALGARAVGVDAAGVASAVYSGFATQAVRTANDTFPRDAYAATAVALLPDVDVIVISTATLRRLTEAQRAALHRAARDARHETIAARDERAAAAAFCTAGGTVVATPPAALDALRAKTARLSGALRRDPATRAALASVARAARSGGRLIQPCVPSPASTAPHGGRRLPNDVRDRLLPPIGSYRRALTQSELRAAGADETTARSAQGVTTLTFYGLPFDPRFVLEWQGAPARHARCFGRAELAGRLVELRWNPLTPCGGTIAFSARRRGRDLAVTSVRAFDDAVWMRAYRGTWKRVDCEPWMVDSHTSFAVEEARLRLIPAGYCR